MPQFGPLSALILSALCANSVSLGHARARSMNLWRGQVKITIPNPHDGDVGIGLLARILRQAGISREEWERL